MHKIYSSYAEKRQQFLDYTAQKTSHPFRVWYELRISSLLLNVCFNLLFTYFSNCRAEISSCPKMVLSIPKEMTHVLIVILPLVICWELLESCNNLVWWDHWTSFDKQMNMMVFVCICLNNGNSPLLILWCSFKWDLQVINNWRKHSSMVLHRQYDVVLYREFCMVVWVVFVHNTIYFDVNFFAKYAFFAFGFNFIQESM